MDKTTMSKFEYGSFYGGFDDFAVSKQRYTKEQAFQLYKAENCRADTTVTIAVNENAWVRHRVGRDEEGTRCVGWWLEYQNHGRNCPVYAMHIARKDELEKYSENITKDYEYLEV